MKHYHIKTQRVFTLIRKYGFIFTLLVAIGGLQYPILGLLVIPIMIGLIFASFYKGRYWCGNICSHGSLYDSVLIKWSRNKNIPGFLKSKAFGALFFTMFAYKLISKFIRVSSLYGSSSFFEKIGMIFVGSYIMVTLLGGALGLIVAPRAWCQFCPMGVIQKYAYKLGKLLGVAKMTDDKLTITKTELCHKCGKCARVCPMQLTPFTDFSGKNQFDDEACIRCSTCVENCPAGILSINNEKTAEIMVKGIGIEGFENRQRIKAKIDKISLIGDQTREYDFKFIAPSRVNYRAGQFMLVKIQDQPETFRAYSISSRDIKDDGVTLTIKRVDKGYGTSIIFDNFKLGDIVELEGPMGDELVVGQEDKNILLVGAGIGITPFVPIVKDLLNKREDLDRITLLYGTRSRRDMLYFEEFIELQSKYGHIFDFRPVLSRDEDWSGLRGYVTDYMDDLDLRDLKVYMCGSETIMKSSQSKLVDLGLDKSSIKYESA